MTLNAEIWVFMDFLAIFGCESHFKSELHQNQLRQTWKLHTKFSAWNVDFDGPSLNFLRSRKPAHKGIKEWYPRKSHYFTVVGQYFVKTVVDKHGHAAYHNKH